MKLPKVDDEDSPAPSSRASIQHNPGDSANSRADHCGPALERLLLSKRAHSEHGTNS